MRRTKRPLKLINEENQKQTKLKTYFHTERQKLYVTYVFSFSLCISATEHATMQILGPMH